MHWDRAILTDSGGFQVFSLDGLRKVREDGVLFRSHQRGPALVHARIHRGHAASAGQRHRNGADECPPYPLEWHKARKSMELTVRWARRAFEHFRALPEDSRVNQALFPIVQGGMYHDLRLGCLEELAGLDAGDMPSGAFRWGNRANSAWRLRICACPNSPSTSRVT